MSQLQVTARFRIHAGNQDAFRAAAKRCMAIVDERDSGTLQYDWFFSADGDECIVRETYRDSDALLEHIGHVGPELGTLTELADIEIELFGDPSPALIEAASGLPTRVFGHFGSAQGVR